MIYFNNENSDKEIKKIINQKNYNDNLYFFILCQFIEKFYIPKEIIRLIFMSTYRHAKIKICNDCNHSCMIINTDKTHLFMDQYHKCNNKKFIDTVKLGTKYVYFSFKNEYVIILGLDGIIRLIDLFNDKLIILDEKIKRMKLNSITCGASRHDLQFYAISCENVLYCVSFVYYQKTTEHTYNKEISAIISCPVKKIKGTLDIIITIDGVASCSFIKNIEIKNVISAYSTCTGVSFSLRIMEIYLCVFLIKNGELQYYERIDDDDNADFKIIPLSFDKKIIYVTGNETHVYVITNDGDAYRLDICSKQKIFHKLYFVTEVKSIRCFKNYTIFLSKTNEVNFLWD